jgi:sialic acid synthase SpsE
MKKCIVIAEVGVNHNGSLERALEMVDRAFEAGVDVVKFQHISKETTFNIADDKSPLKELISRFTLSDDEFRLIKDKCDNLGIEFMSSAADLYALERLIKLGVDKIKISSGNFTNYQLIDEAILLDKHLIFSTGMATVSEVTSFVDRMSRKKFSNYSLLYCVSEYPADFKNINLRQMLQYQELIGSVGFSDHSIGISSALIARSLGATIIEKHFTLDKSLEGPDHSFSLVPSDFENLVRGLKEVDEIFMSSNKVQSRYDESRSVLGRSMYFNKPLLRGHVISNLDIAAKRPFNSKLVSSKDYTEVIGKKLIVDVVVNQGVTSSLFEK